MQANSMKPPAKYTTRFQLLLSPEQKGRVLAIANARGISISEVFRALLDEEFARLDADAKSTGRDQPSKGKRP